MKKAISISIANTLYNIEEDAYADLDRYLRSVKDHFATYPDRDEIVTDIESRISERFSERQSRIVTKADVDELIAVMGKAEEFGDAESSADAARPAEAGAEPKRKLFRDPDEAVTGGVAAGLAAYMGVDVVIVRLIFVISVLFGGTGIIIYIVLWLVMPEAQTATEKLQMKGSPVTLESVKQAVEDKVDEVRTHARQGRFKRFGEMIEDVFGALGRFLTRGVFPLVGRILGFFLAIASTAAFIGLSVAFFSVLFSYPDPAIDFPLGEVMSGPLYYGALLSGFLAIIIPVAFVFMLALSLVRGQSSFSSRIMLPLVGIWLVAAIAFGVASMRASALHAAYVRTNPTYQASTQSFEVGEFPNGIRVANGQRVRIVQATSTSVVAEGRARDLERLDIAVKEGALAIGRKNEAKICIFCWSERVVVTVRTPAVESLELRNGSHVESDGPLALRRLDLELANASNADLELNVAEGVNVKLENGSHAELRGSAASLAAEIENASSLESLGLAVSDADIDAENGSRAEINVLKTLDVTVENGSRLYYEGSPALTKIIRNGSRVESRSATSSTSGRIEFDDEVELEEAPEPPVPPRM